MDLKSILLVGFVSYLASVSDIHANHLAAQFEPVSNTCDAKIDLLLIVDVSGIDLPSDLDVLEKMRTALKDFVSEFRVDPNHVEVAVNVFAKKPHNLFCFNKHTDATSLKEAIGQLKCPGRCHWWQIKTSKALGKAAEDTFEHCHARQGAKKVAIVFTGRKSHEYTSTVAEKAHILHGKASVIAVGVGQAFEKGEAREELEAIASDPELVFVFESLEAVQSAEKKIADAVCNAAKGDESEEGEGSEEESEEWTEKKEESEVETGSKEESKE